jgi:hypothetical protein
MKVRSTQESEKAELAAMVGRGEREAKGVRQRNEGDVVAAQTGSCQLHTLHEKEYRHWQMRSSYTAMRECS